MKKNASSQSIGVQMVTAADGTAFTGAVTVYYTLDNGTQTIGSVGSGVCTHEGNGYHSYAPTQAETNGDHIAWTFVGTGAVAATLQVYTTFPQTVDNDVLASGATGFAAIDTVVDAIKTKTDFLPSATAGSAGGIFIAGTNSATTVTTSFTTTFTGSLTGSVASVTGAVGSLTGHTNQTGDTYALAVGATGFAAIDTVVDAILVDTAEIGTAGVGLTNLGGSSNNWNTTTPPTAATIAGLVWDEELTVGHTIADSAGAKLNAAGAAADPWSVSLPGGYGSGTAGEILGDWLDAGRLDTILDAIPTTAMRGTDSAALATSLVTAQNDLDILTGADGVNLLSATQAKIDAIPTTAMRGTDSAATATALATAQTAIDLIPTTAMRGTDSAALATALATAQTDLDLITGADGATLATVQTYLPTGVISSTAKAGTLTTTAMSSNLTESTDDHYIGRTVVWTTGVLIGQASDITDYVGVNGVLTFSELTEAPGVGDGFIIV